MVYICKICKRSFPNEFEYEFHFPNALEHKSQKELTEIIAVIQEKNTKLQRVCGCVEKYLEIEETYDQFRNTDSQPYWHRKVKEHKDKLQQAIKESKE